MLDKNNQSKEAISDSILFLSRGSSIILLILYVIYLWFQLRTHPNLFNPEAPPPQAARAGEGRGRGEGAAADDSVDVEGGRPPAQQQPTLHAHDAEHRAEYHLSILSAVGVLVIVTVLVSVCADYLVSSIDAIVEASHLSKNFIGLILIPIVGNAAEHVTACVVAVRDKMDLAVSVAIGSSIQIALLVTPCLVILGWAVIGQPMTLHFETFETVAFALSVLVVTCVVQDGKSNYLEGAMLVGLYLIIALAFWASPADALQKAVLYVMAALSPGA